MRCSHLLLVLAVSVCVACGSERSYPPLPELHGSAEARRTTAAAYRFAIENPELLQKVPCYCGCEAHGHRSNLDCFVESWKPGETVKWSEHGAACQICVRVAADVQLMKGDGKSIRQIVNALDTTYLPKYKRRTPTQ